MSKRKLQVTPYPAKRDSDKEPAKQGRAILEGKLDAIVLYKKKRWVLAELLQHLAHKVYDLERNQCKPSAKCLFEGQHYMDKEYLGRSDGTSRIRD